MRKRHYYLIAFCFTGSILVIAVLYFISVAGQYSKSSFIRLFPPHLVSFVAKRDLGFNSYYIAGQTAQTVYLGNTVATTQLICTNYQLTDTHHIVLKTNTRLPVAWGAARLNVDSPYFFLTESVVPSFIRGKQDAMNLLDVKYRGMPFSREQPISGSTYVFRVYDTAAGCNVLVRTNPALAEIPKDSFRLTKQLDGFFCTDGMLLFNKEPAWVIYLYYYRNEFVKLDTNLHLLLKGKTIDSINHVSLKIFTDPVTRQTRMTGPPLFVNKRGCVTSEWLFINSGLMAGNEDRKIFDTFSVIDVYSVITGIYKYSFYLPSYKGLRVSSFRVNGNHLVAVYDRYLVSFRLNF